MTCSVEGCTKGVICRGVCWMHYARLRRTGSVHGAPTRLQRFWSSVAVVPTGCWLWLGRIDAGTGYAGFGQRTGHRWAYEQFVGPVPAGLELDHLCRVRHCVNPAHLEAVTHRENVRRGRAPAALNAAKTHCKRGHAFDERNTYVDRHGRRACRECRRQGYHRRKAAYTRTSA